MPISYVAATDELFGMVKAVLPEVATLVGYDIDVRWPGVENPNKPDALKFWARVSSQNVMEHQASLADVGGKKRYTATGLIYIQLFAPRGVPNAKIDGRNVAELFRDKFRHPSPSTSIWFRDQKIVELDETPENYPFNIVATFEYDTIQ